LSGFEATIDTNQGGIQSEPGLGTLDVVYLMITLIGNPPGCPEQALTSVAGGVQAASFGEMFLARFAEPGKASMGSP
jgi:hypothetical protein